MAKTTVPRHSKTARKPVTIDLEPSDVKPLKPKTDKKTVPAAEPVGDFTQAKKPDVKPVETSTVKPQPTPKSQPDVKPQVTDRATAFAGVSGSTSNIAGKTMNSASPSGPTPPTAAVTSSKSTSPWLAGIAGGVIALLGATALQLSGFGPFSAQTNSNAEAEQALSAQVAKLEQQLSSLQNVPASKPDADLLARLEAAEQNAAEAQKRISELPQTSDTSAADSAVQQEVIQRLNAMEAKLDTTSTQAAQANTAINNDNNAVQGLKEQLAVLQAKVDERAGQPDMTAIIAVNALKSAIDRGGSYTNELQTYLSLQPQSSDAVKDLENLAQVGVPTLSQLNTQFATLADQMVAVENKPAADAGIWDQLVGSAKGLIRSRPVGDIEGPGAGPVTARIEVALQNGDAERAIAEWVQLPEVSKQAGQGLYDKLLARRHADALIAQLIARTAQPAPATVPEPAAQ